MHDGAAALFGNDSDAGCADPFGKVVGTPVKPSVASPVVERKERK
jgi:hypothetical protein